MSFTAEPAFDRRFRAGVREFNAANFFEAHEIWEALWSEEVDEPRRFLRGLVQAAVAYHKAEIGVPGGARKLLGTSLRILEEFPPDAFGVDVGAFRERLAADLRDGGAALPAPRIELLA